MNFFIHRIPFYRRIEMLGLEIVGNELSVSKLEAQDQVKIKKSIVFRGAALSGLDVCHPVCQQLAEWAVR